MNNKKPPPTLFTNHKDFPELIRLHCKNIRAALSIVNVATHQDEPHIILKTIPAIIANAQAIDRLAAHLIGQRTNRKEPPPCSLPLAKSPSSQSLPPSS